MRKVDFSQYQPDEHEQYYSARQSSKTVRLDYFRNEVRFSPDNRHFEILVDPTRESAYLYPEDDWSKAHMREADGGEEDDGEDMGGDDALAAFAKRFDIDNEWEYFYRTEDPYLENVLSGTRIALPIGEGILDFCYTDFKANLKELSFVRLMIGENKSHDKLRESLAEFSQKSHPLPPETIHNFDELDAYKHRLYSNFFTMSASFFYCSLYTAIFPPLFLRLQDKDLDFYIRHLFLLQREFLDLIEFCFDTEFYPQLLGRLLPSERYYFYCFLHKRSPAKSRKEDFEMSITRTYGDHMPFGMPADELAQRLHTPIERSEEFAQFAEKYHIEHGMLDAYLRIPSFIRTVYSCSSIYDMLYLEFTKMLELDIRFKKCKRCGRYFIMKGNYQAEYCDRIAEGETRSCQTLAALQNYKQKIESNEAWSAYRRYYKRYFARTKVGTIKEAAFRKWQYEATYRRDACTNGEITIEDYTAWLDGSFANRKKRG